MQLACLHMDATRDGFRFANRFVTSCRWAYGLCGGMCYAALDYHQAGKSPPQMTVAPTWGTSLHRYLLRRQWDSWRLISVPLRTIGWMLLSDRQLMQRTLGRELPKLLEQLDQRGPAMLLLLRATGINPTVNHQVVVTGYRPGPGHGQLTLLLYDPNHPGREVELYLETDPDAGKLAARQTTGETLKGFFLINYRARTRHLPGGG